LESLLLASKANTLLLDLHASPLSAEVGRVRIGSRRSGAAIGGLGLRSRTIETLLVGRRAEVRALLGFREPHTFALRRQLCPGLCKTLNDHSIGGGAGLGLTTDFGCVVPNGLLDLLQRGKLGLLRSAVGRCLGRCLGLSGIGTLLTGAGIVAEPGRFGVSFRASDSDIGQALGLTGSRPFLPGSRATEIGLLLGPLLQHRRGNRRATFRLAGAGILDALTGASVVSGLFGAAFAFDSRHTLPVFGVTGCGLLAAQTGTDRGVLQEGAGLLGLRLRHPLGLALKESRETTELLRQTTDGARGLVLQLQNKCDLTVTHSAPT
jgi:hypothetical protein